MIIAVKQQEEEILAGYVTGDCHSDRHVMWCSCMWMQPTLTQWEAQCMTLRAKNVCVKDLPPRPKHPLKPKLASGGDGDTNRPSDVSDGNDEGCGVRFPTGV